MKVKVGVGTKRTALSAAVADFAPITAELKKLGASKFEITQQKTVLSFALGKGMIGKVTFHGATYEISIFDNNADGGTLNETQFTKPGELRSILADVLSNPLLNGKAKMLPEGVYWVKTGKVMIFKGVDDPDIKDFVKGAKQVWAVRPYGFEDYGGYLFTSEPKRLSRPSATRFSDIAIDGFVFDTDKGQFVVAYSG